MEPPVCFAFKTARPGVILMHHLTLRVPWYDSKWNGCVCTAPSENPYCVALDRIRDERDGAAEDPVASRPWDEGGRGALR